MDRYYSVKWSHGSHDYEENFQYSDDAFEFFKSLKKIGLEPRFYGVKVYDSMEVPNEK